MHIVKNINGENELEMAPIMKHKCVFVFSAMVLERFYAVGMHKML